MWKIKLLEYYRIPQSIMKYSDNRQNLRLKYIVTTLYHTLPVCTFSKQSAKKVMV